MENEAIKTAGEVKFEEKAAIEDEGAVATMKPENAEIEAVAGPSKETAAIEDEGAVATIKPDNAEIEAVAGPSEETAAIEEKGAVVTMKPENAEKEAVAGPSVPKAPLRLTYNEKVQRCCLLAQPMAYENLATKCYSLIQKARPYKTFVRSGLTYVKTKIRSGESGIVIVAGDGSPLDEVTELPMMSKMRNIPFIYVPSKKDLGHAMGNKGVCLAVLVRENNNYQEDFDEVKNNIVQLHLLYSYN